MGRQQLCDYYTLLSAYEQGDKLVPLFLVPFLRFPENIDYGLHLGGSVVSARAAHSHFQQALLQSRRFAYLGVEAVDGCLLGHSVNVAHGQFTFPVAAYQEADF